MKITAVGGNGFIGREFIQYAARNGHETTVIGSDCDVFSEEGAARVRDTLSGSDTLVFLAAKRSTAGFSLQEYHYNVSLAAQYLQLASDAGLTNISLASSISVYSSDNLPWREEDFQTPLSLYGASKQAMDSLALWYNAKYGMKIKSLRLAQVIGMHERKGFLLNTLIDNAIANRRQTIYGMGVGKRQYIYVRDVCDAFLHCAVTQKEAAGVYNIGMNYNVSIIELAQTVNEVFGNDAGIEMLKDKLEDKKEYLMDVSKAEKELCWKPCYDLKGAFTDIKKHWLED